MQSVIDFFWDVGSYFVFWEVVDVYEEAVILRCGKYHRTLGAGLHWIAPFGIDQVWTENVVTTTEHMDTQTLDTADNIGLIICPVVTWHVSDIRTMLLEIEDAEGVMIDKISGLIGELVGINTYDDIATPEFWRDVTIRSRRACKKYGIHIEKVQYSDLARMRTLRLIND